MVFTLMLRIRSIYLEVQMAQLQDSIGNALEVLPGSESPMDFAAWREQVLATGDENAGLAMHKIVSGKLANTQLKRQDDGALRLVIWKKE